MQRSENTHGGEGKDWQARPSDRRIFAFGPKLQTLYCLSSPIRKYEHPLCLTYFLFIAGYRNLHTFVFSGNFFYLISERKYLSFYPLAINCLLLFPVKPICWCYHATALNLLSSSLPAKPEYCTVFQDNFSGGARGIKVIVVGNGDGDTSSNPGRDWLHFT